VTLAIKTFFINERTGMVSSTSTNSSQPDAWSFCDAVYCISLAERSDRRREARRQFASVGLADRVEFVKVSKHPTDNEQGIWESHMACIARGLAAKAKYMLIFEDDVVFDGFRTETLRQTAAFIEENDYCRLLFLGCLVTGSRPTNNPAVRKVAYRSLAHAYVLERSLAAALVDTTWRGVPFDAMLAQLPEETFAAYPAFAFQSDADSDNANHRHLEKFRRLCGGLKFIQKMNETFHRHRAAIICGHLAVIAIALWLVFR
jgi:hypothetical protein